MRAREGSEGQRRPGLFPHDPVQLHTAGQGLMVRDHHLQGLPHLCFVWCSAVSPPYPFLSQARLHAISVLQGSSRAFPSPLCSMQGICVSSCKVPAPHVLSVPGLGKDCICKCNMLVLFMIKCTSVGYYCC